MKSNCIIVLVGPPGAGKGTQAEKLVEEFDLVLISTGQVLREEVKKGSILGREANEIMGRGELVPDVVVAEVVRQRINGGGSSQGILLDGFPRNLSQASLLEGFQGDRRVIVINVHVDEEVILKRLTGRRHCVDCGRIYNLWLSTPQQKDRCDACGASLVQRDDDRRAVVQNRFRVYREETEPLIEEYSKKHQYFVVDGNQKPQAVYKEVCNKLEKLELEEDALAMKSKQGMA